MNTTQVSRKASHVMDIGQAAVAPEWIHILPAGHFTGRDGAGPFCLSDPQAVIAASLADAMPRGIPMDYEHQILHAPRNGQPAPASGWITSLEARADGIWGRVEWTERAAAHVAAKEYRYVSPVFFHKENGDILSIEMVALTNLPNLAGLKAVASKGACPKEQSMLKALASKLGLAETADAPAVEAAVAALVSERDNLKTSLADIGKAVNSKSAESGEVLKAVCGMSARAETPDPARFVPMDVYLDANRQLETLRAAQSKSHVDALVAVAVKDGKVTPAMEGWARTYASKDPEGFRGWADAAPDLRPGAGGAPGVAVQSRGAGGVTEAERAVCRSMGLSDEEYLKSKGSKA